MGKKEKDLELLSTLGDFTSKENWDKFFTIRGTEDSFEWYAEWPQLRVPLLPHLSSLSDPQILVPGCGSSRLSEELYDAGYKFITNIDFSKVVISDMLRRNVRSRPGMRWRVMDMTSMQLENETFDVVLDKGGLDALMEPELGTKLGNQYLSEVKRVLKFGGIFVCLTLAESHVLGLLLPKFRYGWKVSLHVIPHKPSAKPSLYTFMVIAQKEKSPVLHQISSALNISSFESGAQARGLLNALERENEIRVEYSSGADIIYSLEDLKLGAKGDLRDFKPGRRVQLTLGEPGISLFCYQAILLDARKSSDPFVYRCGIFLVPKARAREWLFSSEEGQWMVVESSKAERLIMVLLDSSHSKVSMDDIQKDLSPLVRQLAPESEDSGAQIPFMAAGDGLKHQKIVHQVTSPLTGSMTVDDVIYENVNDTNRSLPSGDLVFRRLTFERTEGLVQSEALLVNEGSPKVLIESEQRNTRSASTSKKKKAQRKSDSKISASDGHLKVCHTYLASSYHNGIVAGFMLISSCLKSASSGGITMKTIVVGLGAGLLPMFLHACFPFLFIEAVELDTTVFDIARNFFDFLEDNRLKVHIADGIQFIRDVTKSEASEGSIANKSNNDSLCSTDPHSSNASSNESERKIEGNLRTDILIVDVDSSDSSSGLSCPASAFVEESFLHTVKDSLSDRGLFVINLVTRSSSVREMVVSRMKMVFTNLFHLQLEEDVNEVLFALNTNAHINSDCFEEAFTSLENLLKLEKKESKQTIMDAAKKIKFLG